MPKSARQRWQGRDYADVVCNPSRRDLNAYVGFTFDDVSRGQENPVVDGANHLVAIHETRWTLVRHRDEPGSAPDELVNIAGPAHAMTGTEQAEFKRLEKALNQFVKNGLQPLKAA